MTKIPELTRVEILILSALASKELYGLQIVERIQRATQGRESLSLGGLYTTLHRMERKGLVAPRWGESTEARQGARRRYYCVTGLGKEALAESKFILLKVLRLAPNVSGSVMEVA